MPFDKIVNISARGGSLEAPEGSSWRNFGSPIGAGVVQGGAYTSYPGPYPADADDNEYFAELTENPLVSIFAADDNLLETWLDTQPDDAAPEYWDVAARKLSHRIPNPNEASLQMVGLAISVRGRFFGRIIAATGVSRPSNNVANNRQYYDRIDLTLDRDAPRLTLYDHLSVPDIDRTEWNEPQYVWGYLDPVALYAVDQLRVWGEEVGYSSTDALLVDAAELSVSDQSVELELRVRYNPMITTFSTIQVDGVQYNVLSVSNEVGAGRRRFMMLRCHRYLLAT